MYKYCTLKRQLSAERKNDVDSITLFFYLHVHIFVALFGLNEMKGRGLLYYLPPFQCLYIWSLLTVFWSMSYNCIMFVHKCPILPPFPSVCKYMVRLLSVSLLVSLSLFFYEYFSLCLSLPIFFSLCLCVY